jgi:regulator of protease activity HflC (stomatin/prohibitin superfamily)
VDIAQVRSLPLQTVGMKVDRINLWGDAKPDEDRRPYIVAAPRLAEEVRNDLGAGSEARAVTPTAVPGGMAAAETALEEQLRGISSRFALVDADLILNWRVKPDGLLQWLNFASDARVRKAGMETRELVLREIARREVSQFLSTQPLDQVLSPSGTQVATSLRERLQANFDRQGVGVQVVSIQIPALRPPGEAAPLYEELSIDVQNARKVKEEAQRVVGASMAKLLGDARLAETVVGAIEQWRQLLRAKGEADAETREARQRVEQLLAASRGMIATQIKQARAKRWALHLEARRTASEVLGQAAAFHVAPELFMQRSTMEALSRSLGNVRQKYVLGVDASKVHLDIQIQQPDAGLNLGDYLEKKE